MKLGFYTYSYIDRLKMEIEPVLEAVAAAGYAGIDISATWHDDLDPALMPVESRRRYVETAARLGLEIEAVITHLGLAQAQRAGLPMNLRGAVDVARDVGAHRHFPHRRGRRSTRPCLARGGGLPPRRLRLCREARQGDRPRWGLGAVSD